MGLLDSIKGLFGGKKSAGNATSPAQGAPAGDSASLQADNLDAVNPADQTQVTTTVEGAPGVPPQTETPPTAVSPAPEAASDPTLPSAQPAAAPSEASPTEPPQDAGATPPVPPAAA